MAVVYGIDLKAKVKKDELFACNEGIFSLRGKEGERGGGGGGVVSVALGRMEVVLRGKADAKPIYPGGTRKRKVLICIA